MIDSGLHVLMEPRRPGLAGAKPLAARGLFNISKVRTSPRVCMHAKKRLDAQKSLAFIRAHLCTRNSAPLAHSNVSVHLRRRPCISAEKRKNTGSHFAAQEKPHILYANEVRKGLQARSAPAIPVQREKYAVMIYFSAPPLLLDATN